jgi:asparagine synthase (glutamine-hydrolysing)
MCGIAGILRLSEPRDDRALVASMLEPLRRRGPDGEGLDREGPATLGHRRLAILDLSESGRQPMRSPGGRFVISFNGEIYNFRDLRDELGLRQEDLLSSSDTEILLRAWERWGPGALDRMVGQFAFAVYDRDEARLWLARDRFGEKPLFYHLGGGALAFASSIAALLRAPWVPRELDPSALHEYLTLRYVISPRTVVGGVNKLPAGHLLCASPEGVSVSRWYDPRASHATAGNPRRNREDLVEEFGALLVQASRRCLVSDVPVALLLSDGIDSNAVRAALGLGGIEIPAFMYRSVLDRESDAPLLGDGPEGVMQGVMRVTTEDRFRALVPVFSSFTEPVGDGASLATWFLIHEARAHATVFLSGHGGDEVLGGYRLSQDRFRLAALRRFAWLPESWIGSALRRYTFGADGAAGRREALRRVPMRFAPAAARYLIHRPLPAEEVGALFLPGSPAGRYLESIDRLYGECADGATGLDRIQEVLLRTFLSENVLSFADSVAMDSSAELRMPLLDRDLVDFVLRLPPSLRVARMPGRSNTKQILRLWGRRHLPPAVLNLRKRSFSYGTIRNLLKDRRDAIHGFMLDSKALRRSLPGLEGWLDRPIDDYHGPWEGTLWALLTLGIWSEAAGLR